MKHSRSVRPAFALFSLIGIVSALLAACSPTGKAADYTRSSANNDSSPTATATANVTADAATPARQASTSASMPQLIGYKVVASYPHDPTAFTQGLLWHEGALYEGTGLEGRSSIRKLEFPSGRVLRQKPLNSQFFGEGLALVGKRLVQLTWQSGRGFVYDLDTFRQIGEFRYDTEGWGLTYDGKMLIMSDGTDTLTYLDPETFEPKKRLRVTFGGQPLKHLNELEWINGEIWANVWMTNQIARISPTTGAVKTYLDLTGILPRAQQTGSEDVLNGIAYDPVKKRIWVTGKLWPRIFEIRVLE